MNTLGLLLGSTILTDALAFLFVIGILVLLHEAGHFVVAKYLGLSVEVFSVGFGPRLFGKRFKETDYRVSWLPIGGYVKIKGETEDEGEDQTGDANEEGHRPLFFELNGQPQRITVHDSSLGVAPKEHRKADPDDAHHISSPLTGLVASYSHEVGDPVVHGERLCVIEAMKMETNVFATIDARLDQIVVPAGEHVEAGDLLAILKPA